MGRERHQFGYLERVGKRVKQWRGHWYEYRDDKRVHRARILGPCAKLTKGDAQKKLQELIDQSNSPQQSAKPQILKDFIEHVYLPANSRTWSHNTVIVTRYVLQRHIIAHLGDRHVPDIKKIDIANVLNALADDGYSYATILKVLSTFRAIFGEAEEHFDIPNPAKRVRMPLKPDADEKPTLSPDQIEALLTRTAGMVRLLFRTLIVLGLRIGEAMTLRWSDVQGGVMRVDESWTVGSQTKTTKTERVRLVPIPATLAREYATHREVCFFSRDDDFVFCHPTTGKMLTRTSAGSHYLNPARESSGLGELLDFRICRRTCATRMKEAGVHDKDIQAILGHTTPAMTQKHYIQPVAESQRAAVEALARAMSV